MNMDGQMKILLKSFVNYYRNDESIPAGTIYDTLKVIVKTSPYPSKQEVKL
jgi:hypothetical protein